ncbi:flagellar protein FlgN [Paenibacillus marinisediminis]
MEIGAIIDNLYTLEGYYQELIESARRKTRVIVENDIDQLLKCTQAEKSLMKQIAEAEQQLLDRSYAFIQSKGIRSQLKLTVTELSKLVFDPDQRQSLRAVQLKLNDTLESLKELNDHNQQLLDQSLQYVNYRLDLMIEYPDEGLTYKRPEQSNRSVWTAGRMDTRA